MKNKHLILLHLLDQQLTLGAVESVTGGLFASSAVDIKGASRVFKGSLVTYATSLKEEVAKVDPELIKQYGVVSGKTALAMAKNGQKILNVDYCIAFTGNAGPTVQENKPVGDIYIALAYKDLAIVEFYNFQGTRNSIRKQAIEKGWEMIKRVLIDYSSANL